MKIDYRLDKLKAMDRLGLNPGGRVQRRVDAEVIHYLRELMPRDNGTMAANTREIRLGEIWIMTPYAHYMNEGELYVMDNGKGAYYNPTFGFWSKKGVKKHPSGKPLNYNGGANRGKHFVQRTFNEHLDDILKGAREELNK